MFVETSPGQYRRLNAYDGLSVQEHRARPGVWVVIGHMTGTGGAILAEFGDVDQARAWLWQLLHDADLLAVFE